MSSIHVGGATVALVERGRDSMSCEAFKSRLDMVLRVIDNGALGGGVGYGNHQHKSALAAVEKQIAETRARIADMDAEDARLDAALAAQRQEGSHE